MTSEWEDEIDDIFASSNDTIEVVKKLTDLLSQAYTQGKEDERKELLQWVFDILKDEEVKLMSQGGLYNEIRNELKKEIRSKILKRMKGNIDN